MLGKTRSAMQSIVNNERYIIYGPPEFHRLIELERDRVHRNDLQFSLILFNLNRNENNPEPINALVKKISKRVRRVDQIGWYDNYHLAILLPDTSQSGAQTIAKDICRSQDKGTPTIGFETLSYPEQS